MSDHEFEKQVQRKMDEFKLRPSDAVWTAVEKNIRQTRPRRRFGFWLPVGVVIMATTGYLLLNGGLHGDEKQSIAQSKTVAEKNEISSTKNRTSENNSTRNTPEYGAQDQQPVNHVVEQQANRLNDAVEQQETRLNNAVEEQQATRLNDAVEQHQATRLNETMEQEHTIHLNNAVAQQHATRLNKSPIIPEQQKNRRSARLQPSITSVQSNTKPLISKTENTFSFTMPQLASTDQPGIATGKAVPAPLNQRSTAFTMPQSAAPAPLQRKHGPKWVFGAQGNVGISRISQSKLFQVDGWLGSTEKSMAEDLSRQSNRGDMLSSPGIGYNSFINTAPPPSRTPSVIRQGLSYSIGAYAQRPLSKRLRLTIGLNYAYMSAHTDIGKLVERPTIVNMGTASANVVNRYYTSADAVIPAGSLNTQWQNAPESTILHEYTYRFHNIEIPVTINWQMNKGRQLPPFVLDAGLSVSKLLSADALHYDGTKGIYYKNDKLFNKTFVNAILGMNVGLFQQSKTPVWVGPHLRYSLTGLLDKSVSNGQFMWSAGMNIRVQLSR